jgi:putative SOS response-associated peptidase YedK
MCGRYRLSTHPHALYEQFALELVNPDEREVPPRYNIAPTQPVLAVRLRPDGRRELVHLHWGLIPHWAKEPSIGNRMINARSETVGEKPSFRNALRRRRCLIPADGFYEWQKQGRGPKLPFDVSRRDGAPFAFAGLWEHWQGPNGEEIESCAILTTAANDLMRPIHDRMPVIIFPEDYDAWLALDEQKPEALAPLLATRDWPEMQARPIATIVNNVRNEGPQCLTPAQAAAPPGGAEGEPDKE